LPGGKDQLVERSLRSAAGAACLKRREPREDVFLLKKKRRIRMTRKSSSRASDIVVLLQGGAIVIQGDQDGETVPLVETKEKLCRKRERTFISRNSSPFTGNLLMGGSSLIPKKRWAGGEGGFAAVPKKTEPAIVRGERKTLRKDGGMV